MGRTFGLMGLEAVKFVFMLLAGFCWGTFGFVFGVVVKDGGDEVFETGDNGAGRFVWFAAKDFRWSFGEIKSSSFVGEIDWELCVWLVKGAAFLDFEIAFNALWTFGALFKI